MNYKKKFKISAFLLICFFAMMGMLNFVDVAPIGPNGTSTGFATINQAVNQLFGYNHGLYILTNIFGVVSILICVVFGFVGLMQWIKRKNILKVDLEIISLGVLYIITISIYVIFTFVAVNYRPIIMAGETMPEASFPSSHTVLIYVVFGSAVMLLDKYIKNKQLAKNLKPICKALILITALARLISGVHWFTDIIAGLIISSSLLFSYSGVLDIINKKK